MSYSKEEAKQRGIDYDLEGCLEYNSQPFSIEDIDAVLAVHEGENDGDDWRWIIRLTKDSGKKNGGRFVFLQGGCDYTGWDCQSWAKSSFAKTSRKAAEFAKTGPDGATIQDVAGGGFEHMLSVLSGTYADNFPSVYDELIGQLKSKKSETWREKKDKEFGV